MSAMSIGSILPGEPLGHDAQPILWAATDRDGSVGKFGALCGRNFLS